MKLSTNIFNIILALAVVFLYYLHFSNSKKNPPYNGLVNLTKPSDTSDAHSSIAYVELDSMYEKISYIKERRKELENEQKAIETEWENSMKSLEAKKNEFLKKGSAITQQEAEQFQTMLQQQQQVIEAKKQSLGQKLNEKSLRVTDDIQKKLKDFLATYNANKNLKYILTTGSGLDYMVYKDTSLNITNDVINGMNEKMKTLK